MCVSASFTALRCWSNNYRSESTPPHHTVRAAFLSMLADRLLVAVVLSTKPYMYWSHFLYVLGIAFFTVFVILGEGGAYTRSFFRRKRAWVPLFFTIKKVPGNLEHKVPS